MQVQVLLTAPKTLFSYENGAFFPKFSKFFDPSRLKSSFYSVFKGKFKGKNKGKISDERANNSFDTLA